MQHREVFPSVYRTSEIDRRSIQNAVNASELHRFINSKTRFSDWIRRRIENYGFVESVDYAVVLKTESNAQGGAYGREFIITLDMAKELAMVENNEKGRQIRRYFIEVEKKATKINETQNCVALQPSPLADEKGQGLLFPLPASHASDLHGLMIDVALQAKAGSKLAQFIRQVKPLVLAAKGGPK